MQCKPEELPFIEAIWAEYCRYCMMLDDRGLDEEPCGLLLHNGVWKRIPPGSTVTITPPAQPLPDALPRSG